MYRALAALCLCAGAFTSLACCIPGREDKPAQADPQPFVEAPVKPVAAAPVVEPPAVHAPAPKPEPEPPAKVPAVREPEPNPEAKKAVPVSLRSVYVESFSTLTLGKRFTDNEAQLGDSLGGKVILVSGEVSRVARLNDNMRAVTLNTIYQGRRPPPIVCHFGNEAKLGDLSAGATVGIYGTLRVRANEITLLNCERD